MSNVFHGMTFDSPEGQRNKAYIESRLSELRSKLEDPALSDSDTHLTRGAIKELKSMFRTIPQRLTTPTYGNRPKNQEGMQ